jgi:hypothetical protein
MEVEGTFVNGRGLTGIASKIQGREWRADELASSVPKN